MIKRRHEAARERIAAYDATLRRTSPEARPAPDFDKALREAKRGFETDIIRDAWAWRPKLKTRNPARLKLAAARYLFARYAVPAHLETVWLGTDGLSGEEVLLRKRWYIAAARGCSLYKGGASVWLSRKEVHAFLNPPGELSFDEAFWVAIVRSSTDDVGLALRIARSKIARTPRSQLAFWREVARFFVANPVRFEEIDDLCDYLGEQHRRDAAYSLKGRTLVSLHRRMQEWHQDLAAIERIEAMRRRAQAAANRSTILPPPQGRSWLGSTLLDWDWQPSAKDAKSRGERFVVRQLITASELVVEGRAMHHCVSMYAAKCMAGNASIWVLRRQALGKTDRMLTIELDRQHRAVQVRGFGNRLATAEERQVLGRWAKARGVVLPQ